MGKTRTSKMQQTSSEKLAKVNLDKLEGVTRSNPLKLVAKSRSQSCDIATHVPQNEQFLP